MKKTLYTLLTVLGGLIMALEGVMAIISNMTTGIILLFLFGAFMLCWGIWHEKLDTWTGKGILKVGKYLLFAGIGVFVGIGIFIGCMGVANSVDYQEDAIIVLGAGIRGETVLEPLRLRLEAAAVYLDKNPKAVAVVSGGKGPQESITEAEAMQRYLLGKGVPVYRIIKEEKATSTYENFVYSKELLDALLEKPYKVAYVTNDFHLYRAGELAKYAGLDGAGVGTETPWYIFMSSYTREVLAVIKLWVFNN